MIVLTRRVSWKGWSGSASWVGGALTHYFFFSSSLIMMILRMVMLIVSVPWATPSTYSNQCSWRWCYCSLLLVNIIFLLQRRYIWKTVTMQHWSCLRVMSWMLNKEVVLDWVTTASWRGVDPKHSNLLILTFERQSNASIIININSKHFSSFSDDQKPHWGWSTSHLFLKGRLPRYKRRDWWDCIPPHSTFIVIIISIAIIFHICLLHILTEHIFCN